MTCKIGSVPSPDIKWVREGAELLNSSVREASAGRRFLILTSHDSEVTTSSLILTQVSGEIQDLDVRPPSLDVN